jgi:hypothetical protein
MAGREPLGELPFDGGKKEGRRQVLCKSLGQNKNVF